MSTNEIQHQQFASSENQPTSPWSGEARETWVSSAIAAATASLRETVPGAGESTECETGTDPL